MTEGADGAGMVPVERAELATPDMDTLADLVRQTYTEHEPLFRRLDPAVGLRAQAATACGLHASVLRYDGFTYSSTFPPVNPPTACVCRQGTAMTRTTSEEVRLVPGGLLVLPSDRPAESIDFTGEYIMLQSPWAAIRDLAEESAGVPAAGLRFEAPAPVSPARQQAFARTAEFITGQLVTSGAAGIHPLVLPELTRLTAAAFLEAFPNTTMTAGYVPGPGWVPPVAVHRAVTFIAEHAAQPVTAAQIAAAAGVSGRALREAFLRYFEITPLGFLRRARLERAYRQLGDADPASGVTVAAVARQWGWASPSRFAAAYRQRFGVPPSQTLRS